MGFRVFKKNLHSSPSIFFTDYIPAMKDAIAKEWPDTTHLLYIFHLYKNFCEHCRKVFTGKEEQWREICWRWWRLCKKSNSRFVDSFNHEWGLLEGDILDDAKASMKDEKKFRTLKKWLEGMRMRAPQWAACLTYRYRTFGMHSTQRAEAIHSAMQSRFAAKNSTFLQLVKDLERMSDELEFRSCAKGYRDTLRSKMLLVTGNKPVIYLPGNHYGDGVSGHARHLITKQCVNLVQFKVARDCDGPNNVPLEQQQYFTQRLLGKEKVASMDDPQDFVLDVEFGLQYCYDEAGHITTLQSCTCQFPDCHGMACAHMWAVAHRLTRSDVLDYLMPCDPFYRKSIDMAVFYRIFALLLSLPTAPVWHAQSAG
jgi:hypothetical protein